MKKELNPGKEKYKVRCNYNGHHDPLNPEFYFVDQRIKKLREKNKKEEEFARIEYLKEIRQKIILVSETTSSTFKIKQDEFITQIAYILILLLESLQPFFSKDENFQKAIKSNQKADQAVYPNPAWLELKEQIDHMSKFPIAQFFVWRANNTYALSSLVMPIAFTCTNPRSPNVGFLTLGFRNIIENSKGKKVHLRYETEEELKEFARNIRSVYKPLIHPYMDKIYYDQIFNKSVKDNATRAAVARVEARNLSHNIGSHVVEGLAREMKYRHTEKMKEGLEDETYSYLNLSKFLSFLRSRMGFIADISTGRPHLTVTSKLIVNVLNTFIKHQKGKKNNSDEKEITNKNFLKAHLNFISGFPDRDHKSIEVQVVDESDQDDLVALPNGHLGAHALYVILENIIRNAFKYTAIKKLELLIDFKKCQYKDFIRLKIIDTSSQKRSKKEVTEIVKHLREILDEEMIDKETNKLREKNWGILESKISAAYLRQIDLVDIDKYSISKPHADFSPPLLNVIEEKNNLVYELFLLRPKEIEILCLDRSFFNKVANLNLDTFGIKSIYCNNQNELNEKLKKIK